MRTSKLGAVVLAAIAVAAGTSAAEAPRRQAQAQLEISLVARGVVPGGEILGWVLKIDGVQVDAAASGWAGPLPPGPHVIGVQVHYWRDLKTLVHRKDDRVELAFVEAGERWVRMEYPVHAGPASVVRLEATLDDNPEEIDDRLLFAQSIEDRRPAPAQAAIEEQPRSERAAASPPPAPRRELAGPSLAEQIEERTAEVAALVAPQLARTGGGATVRVAVDRGGYLSDFQLDPSTDDRLRDRVAQILRLAAPFPPFEGYLTVRLPL